jgi:hypothetical protein
MYFRIRALEEHREDLEAAAALRFREVTQSVDRLESNIDTQKKFFGQELARVELKVKSVADKTEGVQDQVNSLRTQTQNMHDSLLVMQKHSEELTSGLTKVISGFKHLRFDVTNAVDDWLRIRFGQDGAGQTTVSAADLHGGSGMGHIPHPPHPPSLQPLQEFSAGPGNQGQPLPEVVDSIQPQEHAPPTHDQHESATELYSDPFCQDSSGHGNALMELEDNFNMRDGTDDFNDHRQRGLRDELERSFAADRSDVGECRPNERSVEMDVEMAEDADTTPTARAPSAASVMLGPGQDTGRDEGNERNGEHGTVESVTEQTMEKAAEQTVEKAAEQTVEKAAEQTVEKAAEQKVEKAVEQTVEKAAEQILETATDDTTAVEVPSLPTAITDAGQQQVGDVLEDGEVVEEIVDQVTMSAAPLDCPNAAISSLTPSAPGKGSAIAPTPMSTSVPHPGTTSPLSAPPSSPAPRVPMAFNTPTLQSPQPTPPRTPSDIVREHRVEPPAGMLAPHFRLSPPSSQPTIPSPTPNRDSRLLDPQTADAAHSNSPAVADTHRVIRSRSGSRAVTTAAETSRAVSPMKRSKSSRSKPSSKRG